MGNSVRVRSDGECCREERDRERGKERGRERKREADIECDDMRDRETNVAVMSTRTL